MEIDRTIPEHFKKLKVFNWGGIFYYKGHPCTKINEEISGKIIDTHSDYPAGYFDIYDTGLIHCKTIAGTTVQLINYDIDINA